MMRFRVIIVVITAFWGTCLMAGATHYFDHLDKLIKEHDMRIANKKRAIDKIKNTLPAPSSDPAVLAKEYDINNALYNEYAEFQNDSAQHYMRRNISIFGR